MRRARRSTKGGYSLSAEREYPPLHPPRERALIGSFGLERLLCLRNGNARARRCRVRTARRFASASIIRCRSADLVLVQPNHRLPIVRILRRAPAMPPWQAMASLYKSEVVGNCVRVTNRRQSDSEDRSKPSRLDTTPGRHLITRKGYATSVRQQSCQRLCNPQAAQLFKCQSANAKPFSWGSKGAILFCERE